jgi:urocanate hydratase
MFEGMDNGTKCALSTVSAVACAAPPGRKSHARLDNALHFIEEKTKEMTFEQAIRQGIPRELPEMPAAKSSVNRAPRRSLVLSRRERVLAVKNALRYFPRKWHPELAREFARELAEDGRIYMRRFRPAYEMRARPIGHYPAKCQQAAAIMHMIQNNLDERVAQHPLELVTYGGNGAVFQNWAQYLITMRYLSEMSDYQTLVLYSGHPVGLFFSHPDAPRVVVTNGMVVPNYSKKEDYDRMAALGVTSYGQMTAGSFMYIGPQGIVHGTTITLLGAARKYLGLDADQGLEGKLFVSSGLGGMSGAQAKASVIAGAVGVIAEINPKALGTRFDQGWLSEHETKLDKLLLRVEAARKQARPVSIGYLGNVVDLLEAMVDADIQVDLGSDQTSLHNPFGGGYYPSGQSLDVSNREMIADPVGFKHRVQASLRDHVAAVHALARRGMHFWDYGNAFLLEASRAGAEGIVKADGTFAYPSYVEDIMGPRCFDYGFGPFRWVCTSGEDSDLAHTDQLALDVLSDAVGDADPEVAEQLLDNIRWIKGADENDLVVGSKARILYADCKGRVALAHAFNRAIKSGAISAPIVLGRDHHDVSGTDSPFRETADIADGSRFTADMAVQNFAGDAFRGATWVSLHNGGGVGWGEAVNGGFGLVLDGTESAARRARHMLTWDVANGLARRAWAGHPGARRAVARVVADTPSTNVTLPEAADDELVEEAVSSVFD